MNESAQTIVLPMASRSSSQRVDGVDVFRLIAIFAVICLHTMLVYLPKNLDLHTVWNWVIFFVLQSARFAVPFFFSISGYFWGQKIRKGVSVAAATIPMAKRLGVIFVFWCLIYLNKMKINTVFEYGLLGPLKFIYWSLLEVASHPCDFLLNGDAIHLWFLPALLCSLGITAFFVAWKQYRLLIAVAVALYLIGLLARAYAVTPMGLHLTHGSYTFNTRNGPFFGTLFFVSGYFLSGVTPRREWFRWGMGLLFVGLTLHMTEVFLLWRIYHSAFDQQDYVVGTVAMGIGATLVALSKHRFLNNRFMAQCGRYTLGIYCVHLVFVILLDPLAGQLYPAIGEIVFPVVVLALSLVSVQLLSRFRFTRRFVQ